MGTVLPPPPPKARSQGGRSPPPPKCQKRGRGREREREREKGGGRESAPKRKSWLRACPPPPSPIINIGFPAHFRHLFIQFHQFSIQFRPEKLTAFKSKVQFRQIVIHNFVVCQSNLKIQHSNSSIVTEIRLCRKASYECKDQIRHSFKQIHYHNFVIQIRQVLLGLYIWETILIETLTKMNVNRRNCFCCLVLRWCDRRI